MEAALAVKRARRGNLLWITLGVLFLAACGVALLSQQVIRETRATTSLREAASARWTAHAAVATFGNHLKMRPWAERFYASSSASATAVPAPEYPMPPVRYGDREARLWARDSVRGSKVLTGCTDVFATAHADGTTYSVYQRLAISTALATNPRALRVVRERTLINVSLETPEARTKLLEQITAEDRRAAAESPLAEVSARGMDAAAQQDLEVQAAVDLVRAQAGERETEQRFQELMQKGRDLVDRVDYAEAARTFDEAAAIGTGSGPVHRAQRSMAAQVAAARAKYAQALAMGLPQRNDLARDVVSRLDAIVKEFGTECAGPTAAYFKAQIQVLIALAGRGGRGGANGADGQPLAPTDREQVVVDITTELTALLQRLGPGKTFEGGSVPLDQLPPQFADANRMTLAYTDAFVRLVTFNFIFFKLQFAIPVSQRLSLTDRTGRKVRTLISSGQFDPDCWIAGGQALVATDHGGDSGYDVVILDRTGKIIAGFKGVKPVATAESGGVWVAPGGDRLVIFGLGPDDKLGYWVQDLRSPNRPRRVGPTAGKDAKIDHDPLQFSADGTNVAFVDPSGNVKVAATADFLAGTSEGSSVLTFQPDHDDMRAPAFAWMSGGSTWMKTLVAFTNSSDKKNAYAGQLALLNVGIFQWTTSYPLPSNFTPGLIVSERGRQSCVVMDQDNTHYIRFGLNDSTIAAPQALPDGTYHSRPGHDADDVLYIAGQEANGSPGIWKWDLPSGRPPEKMPLPPEVGPTKAHVITTPVSH